MRALAAFVALPLALASAETTAHAQTWPAPRPALPRWSGAATTPVPLPPPPQTPARSPGAPSARSSTDRPRGTIDGSESVTFYALGGAVGLLVGAWSVTAAYQSPGDSAPVASLVVPVLGAGLGVVGAALIDGRREIRRGRVYAANAGFYLGLLASFSLNQLPDGPFADADHFEKASGYLGAAGLGLGAGIALGHATDSLPGSGSFVLSGGVWGAVIGASLDRAFRDARTDGAAGLLAGEAIGVTLALVSAHALAPTVSQARWLDLGALIGTLGGVLLTVRTDNAQTAALVTALGCFAGGTLGFVLAAPSDVERELQRRASRSTPRITPTFTPVPGGGVVGVAL